MNKLSYLSVVYYLLFTVCYYYGKYPVQSRKAE